MEKSEISSEKKLYKSNSHKCKGESTRLHKKKRKKISRSSSSSSTSSNSSVDSSSSDSNNSHHGVERGTSKYHKKKVKKVKKSIKKKEKKKMKSKLKEIKKSLKHKPSTSKDVQITSSNNNSELSDKAKAMAPMTKEEWEKRQSIIRRVYDEETGRYRLIKGDGEILEEIVSRERHKEINQKATKGDGEYFQSQLKLNTSFK